LARFLPQDKAAAPKKQDRPQGAKEETVRQKARRKPGSSNFVECHVKMGNCG
jgi:hypothetical protein